MHIITNLYFKISLNFLQSNFIICVHKFFCIIHNHSFYTKKIYTQFNLLMKVDKCSCFILPCWNFPNQIVSYNTIGIFENLAMNMGACTWVESFWNYNAKVIDYWTIFLINMNKIINRNLTQIQKCIWCCWKVVTKLDLIKFISQFSYLKWNILNFEWILLLKIQKNHNKLGLEGKMSWVCSHLGPTTHVTLSIHELGKYIFLFCHNDISQTMVS
jgi:hypothetical protein